MELLFKLDGNLLLDARLDKNLLTPNHAIISVHTMSMITLLTELLVSSSKLDGNQSLDANQDKSPPILNHATEITTLLIILTEPLESLSSSNIDHQSNALRDHTETQSPAITTMSLRSMINHSQRMRTDSPQPRLSKAAHWSTILHHHQRSELGFQNDYKFTLFKKIIL